METWALWASVAFGGIAQIALKLAVSGRLGAASSNAFNWWLLLARSGWFWLYVICFGAATALWLLALSKLNISYAFPLLSAGYVFVALLARSCLGEVVSARRWFAIAVICFGVVLIARS